MFKFRVRVCLRCTVVQIFSFLFLDFWMADLTKMRRLPQKLIIMYLKQLKSVIVLLQCDRRAGLFRVLGCSSH